MTYCSEEQDRVDKANGAQFKREGGRATAHWSIQDGMFAKRFALEQKQKLFKAAAPQTSRIENPHKKTRV